MSLRPPSTRGAGARPSSAANNLSQFSAALKGDSFAFTPDQRVSVREWIDGGLAVLKAAQQHINSNAIFSLDSSSTNSNTAGNSNLFAAGSAQRPVSSKAGAANNTSSSSKPTPTQAALESQFQQKFQVLSASLDSLAHESALKNEEQFEQLTIRLLVRVILCLGILIASTLSI